MTAASSFALENRASIVTVGTTEIKNIGQQQGLRCSFEIKRSLKANEPNTCDLKIYNLAERTRRAIEQAAQDTNIAATPGTFVKVVPVTIVAGYVGHMSTVFLGELRSAQTTRSGTDLVTELQTGDGDQAITRARLNKGFPKGSTGTQGIEAILDAMKCGRGNLQSEPVQQVLKGSTIYQRGVLLRGSALDHLKDLCRSLGLEVSVQDQAAQFLLQGQPLAGQAYSISSKTGMLETPSVDTKGVLSTKTFILPGLVCGGPIVMDAESVKGLFRITSTEIVGDTHDHDWEIRVEAKRYGLAP